MRALLIPTLAVAIWTAAMSGGSQPAYASAANPPQIVIEGRLLQSEQPFFIHNNELYAPVKVIFEQLGYKLEWDEELQAAIGSKQDMTIQLKPGNPIAFVNRIVVDLKAIPRMVDGSLYIPVRAVSAAIDSQVVWNDLTQTLFIKKSLASYMMDALNQNEHVTFEGETLHGLKHGTGILYYNGAEWYKGSFKENKLEGYGKLYRDGILLYSGTFADNIPHGPGTLYYANGSSYTGKFDKGRPNGTGTLHANGSIVYSGEWKNGRMEGLGKLYANGTLVYDGSFSNNQRSGYGIEYSEGKKRYAGHWKAGVREGDGQLFDNNGKLVFGGTWSSGFRNGSGRSYSSKTITSYTLDANNKIVAQKEDPGIVIQSVTYVNDKLLAEGDELVYIGTTDQNGMPHGSGELFTYEKGIVSERGTLKQRKLHYSGQFIDGKMSGYGKQYDRDEKLVYEGQFNNGLRSGLGRSYRDGVISYEGGWSNDLENGTGRVYEYDSQFYGAAKSSYAYLYEGNYKYGKLIQPGNIYRYYGDFAQGTPEGYGRIELIYDSQSSSSRPTLPIPQSSSGTLIYEGAIQAGVKHGQGKQYENGVLVYSGSFEHNERHGSGTMYQDQLAYTGTFVHNKREGNFIVTNPYRYKVFEGTFKNHYRNGYGKAYDEYGRLVYEGDYADDKRNGFGKLYDSQGNIIYQGEFRADQTITDYMRSLKNP